MENIDDKKTKNEKYKVKEHKNQTIFRQTPKSMLQIMKRTEWEQK